MARYTIETSVVQNPVNLPEFQSMIEKYMTRKICIFKIYKILNDNSKIFVFINTDLSREVLLEILGEIKNQAKIAHTILFSGWIQAANGADSYGFSPEELDPIYGMTLPQTETSFNYKYSLGQNIQSIVAFSLLLLYMYFMISSENMFLSCMGIIFFALFVYSLKDFLRFAQCVNNEIVLHYYFQPQKKISWNDIFKLKVYMSRVEWCTIITSESISINIPLIFTDSIKNKFLKTVIERSKLSYFDERIFQKPKMIGSV